MSGKSKQKKKVPDEKPTVTLPGKVEKIVPGVHPGQPEKAQTISTARFASRTL
jgi:hypothetical protein